MLLTSFVLIILGLYLAGMGVDSENSYYEVFEQKEGASVGNFLTASTGIWHQRGTPTNRRSGRGYHLIISDVGVTHPGDRGPGLAVKAGFIKPEGDFVITPKGTFTICIHSLIKTLR